MARQLVNQSDLADLGHPLPVYGLSNAAASHWPIQISRSLSGIMEYGSVLLDDAHRWARVRASEQIDRLWAAAIIGRFPRYIHQLSSRLALPKTVLSISSGLKDHRVLFGRRWKTNKEKKKEKSMPASRRGEDDVCPKRSLHACVRRVCGFMPAHYSSLPLTGNYAEWKLSLPKWASIVPTIHTVMLPYPANTLPWNGDNRASNRNRDSCAFQPLVLYETMENVGNAGTFPSIRMLYLLSSKGRRNRI